MATLQIRRLLRRRPEINEAEFELLQSRVLSRLTAANGQDEEAVDETSNASAENGTATAEPGEPVGTEQPAVVEAVPEATDTSETASTPVSSIELPASAVGVMAEPAPATWDGWAAEIAGLADLDEANGTADGAARAFQHDIDEGPTGIDHDQPARSDTDVEAAAEIDGEAVAEPEAETVAEPEAETVDEVGVETVAEVEIEATPAAFAVGLVDDEPRVRDPHSLLQLYRVPIDSGLTNGIDAARDDAPAVTEPDRDETIDTVAAVAMPVAVGPGRLPPEPAVADPVVKKARPSKAPTKVARASGARAKAKPKPSSRGATPKPAPAPTASMSPSNGIDLESVAAEDLVAIAVVADPVVPDVADVPDVPDVPDLPEAAAAAVGQVVSAPIESDALESDPLAPGLVEREPVEAEIGAAESRAPKVVRTPQATRKATRAAAPKPVAAVTPADEPLDAVTPAAEPLEAAIASPKPTAAPPRPKPVAMARPKAAGAATAIAASCPYCAMLLEPPPEVSRRCPRCRERIIVKHVEGRVVYLTEASVRVFDAERRRMANAGRWTKERQRWLKVAADVDAPADRIARLEAALISEEVVSASRTLYVSTVERSFWAAKRDRRWEDASGIMREHALVMYRIAGSPMPPPEDVVKIHRTGVAAALRGIGGMARDAELVSAGCCDVCGADDGRIFRISDELREPRLPHEGCPRGLCRCDWYLAERDQTMVRQHLRRRAKAEARTGSTVEAPTP